MKSADRGIIHCNAVKWGHIVTAFKDDKMRIIHCNAVKWGAHSHGLQGRQDAYYSLQRREMGFAPAPFSLMDFPSFIFHGEQVFTGADGD